MVILETATYLKAKDIEHEAVGEILDGGDVREPDETGFKTKVFEVGVKIGAVSFRWTMNKKSQRNLISKWGNDTSTWIGKKIVFWKVRQQVFNEMKDVIYARPSNSGETHEGS